jgi:DNA-binding NarL/FixJ family response regulator
MWNAHSESSFAIRPSATSWVPQEVAGSGTAAFSALTVMQHLGFGMVVVTADQEYVSSNALGESRFRALKTELRSPCANDLRQRLSSAIARAVLGLQSLIVVRAAGADLRFTVMPWLAENTQSERSLIAITFERTQGALAVAAVLFAKHHKLTASEQSVLVALTNGHSVTQVASDLGVAVSTIRTHVRHLFEKTGARNLRALVSLLVSLPPVSTM